MAIEVKQLLLNDILSKWATSRINWEGYKVQLEYYKNISTKVSIVADYYIDLVDDKKKILKNSHPVNNILWKSKLDGKISLEQFSRLNYEMYKNQNVIDDWEKNNKDKKYNNEYPKELLKKFISHNIHNEYFSELDIYFSSDNSYTKRQIDWFIEANKDYYSKLLNENDYSGPNIRSVIDNIVIIFENTNSIGAAQGANKKVINQRNNILDVMEIFIHFRGFQSNIKEIDKSKISHVTPTILKEGFGIYNLRDEDSFIYNSRVDELFESLFVNYNNENKKLEYVKRYYTFLKNKYLGNFENFTIDLIDGLLPIGLSEKEKKNIQLNLQVDQMIYFYTNLISKDQFVKEQYKNIKDNNIWFVKPGEKAEVWQDCFNDHNFRFGFDDVMEVLKEKDSKSLQTIKEVVNKKYPGHTRYASIINNFVNDFKNGDLLIACKGVTKIIGIGKILSNVINFNINHDGYNSTIEVDWNCNLDNDPILIEHIREQQISRDTVSKCSKIDARKIIREVFFRNNYEKQTMESNEGETELNKYILNKILYGPPGTGKTFRTKKESLSIINETLLDKIDENYIDLFEKGQIKFITFHPSYSYEDFVEGIRPQIEDRTTNSISFKYHEGIFKKISRIALNGIIRSLNIEGVGELNDWSEYESILKKVSKALKDKKSKYDFEVYVLIIDEINRGDISKIFGELITLIEDDKRIGKNFELIVQLPYSGDYFGVPPNLYILGTMNTADRSLALIDIALRRRFYFEEMRSKLDDFIENPVNFNSLNSNLIKKSAKALLKLNDIFAQNVDIGRDKNIGHGYLCNIENDTVLKEVWINKIFPLIEEYYFFDKNKLQELMKTHYTMQKGWIKNINFEDFFDMIINENN